MIAVDSLCHATGADVERVRFAAEETKHIAHICRARDRLRLCVGRAESPPESRLRLVVVRSGLPTPTPQVVITSSSGRIVTTADLAYESARVAIFYDGAHHLTRAQRDADYRINATLETMGWRVVRVSAEMLRNHRALVTTIGSALEQQGALR